MKVTKCENVYMHCAVNCYPHCLDFKYELICFATRNSVAFYNIKLIKSISLIKNRKVISCCQHKDMVNSVRWIANTNDQFLISSSVDKTCIIWEKVAKSQPEECQYEVKHILSGHIDSVIVADSIQHRSSTFFSVSSCNDQIVRYWKDAKLLLSENVKCFIFDIKIYQDLAVIPGLVIIMTGSNELVNISRFNLENNQLENLISLKGHGDWIKTVDLIQFNNSLLLASGSQDFLIRVYNIKETQSEDVNFHQQSFLLKTEGVQLVANLETVLCGHEGWVTNIKWHLSHDGKLYLLSSSMDKTIILWEPLDDIWNEAYRFGEVGGNAIGFLGCCSIPQKRLIMGYSFSGSVNFWEQMVEGQWHTSVPITGHFNEVTDLVWEPKGEYFLTCSTDQTTRLHSYWKDGKGSPLTWHEIGRPQVHGYDLKCIAMAGRLKFISGADEKVIRLFNATKYFIDSWRLIASPDGETSSFENEEQIAECAVVPALGLSNSAVYDSSQINEELKPKVQPTPPTEEVLQKTLWPEQQKLYGHGYELFAIAVNSNATLLASACKASNAQHASVILWDLKSFKKIGQLSSHNLTVTQVRFSHDDKYLLSVSRDRTWALFDAQKSYRRLAFSDKRSGVHSRIIWDCAWTPDSKAFVTGSRDKSVVIWTVSALSGADEEPVVQVTSLPAILTLEESVTSVDVHCSLENPYLACLALENGRLLLYSFSLTGHWSLLKRIEDQGHTLAINKVRFSPKTSKQENGKQITVQLASCSTDRAVKLFHIDLH